MMLLLALSFNINAQSWAEKYNELTSIWNASGHANGVNPTDMTNKDKRKFIDAYVDSLRKAGHSVNKYFFSSRNAYNNLAILHYDPREHTVENVLETVTVTPVIVPKDTVSIETIVVKNIKSVLNTIVDTVFISVEAKPVRDTVEVKNEYCNCTGLSVDEAWNKHSLLRNSYTSDRKHNNHQLNAACRVKLRRYIHDLVNLQKRIANDKEDLEEITENQKTLGIVKNGIMIIPFTGMVDTSKIELLEQPSIPKKNVTKKRRAKRLGKGYSKTRNTGFLSWLFPFRNCK